MENQIISSQFRLAGAHLVNGVNFDTNSVLLFLIFVALLLVAFSLFGFVKYNRDKNNVPSSTTVDKLKADVAYYTSDFEAINQRLKALEQKQDGIDAIHKGINEVKKMLRGE
jgi:hypothetical protein